MNTNALVALQTLALQEACGDLALDPTIALDAAAGLAGRLYEHLTGLPKAPPEHVARVRALGEGYEHLRRAAEALRRAEHPSADRYQDPLLVWCELCGRHHDPAASPCQVREITITVAIEMTENDSEQRNAAWPDQLKEFIRERWGVDADAGDQGGTVDAIFTLPQSTAEALRTAIDAITEEAQSLGVLPTQLQITCATNLDDAPGAGAYVQVSLDMAALGADNAWMLCDELSVFITAEGLGSVDGTGTDFNTRDLFFNATPSCPLAEIAAAVRQKATELGIPADAIAISAGEVTL